MCTLHVCVQTVCMGTVRVCAHVQRVCMFARVCMHVHVRMRICLRPLALSVLDTSPILSGLSEKSFKSTRNLDQNLSTLLCVFQAEFQKPRV